MGAAISFAVAVYLLPAIIASGRGHKHTTSITVLNVFLGWTLAGWLIALTQACSHQPEDGRA